MTEDIIQMIIPTITIHMTLESGGISSRFKDAPRVSYIICVGVRRECISVVYSMASGC